MNRQSETTRNSLNVGAVNYLNTKPLISSLSEWGPARLVLDLPSRLADSLEQGRLDVALIPSVELFHHREYTVVSDACIACRGPVLSVKLYFRIPPARVETVALDEGSRTSVVLAQLLLLNQLGISPELQRLPIGDGLSQTNADAILLIGDRAIDVLDEPFLEVWDLGERWWESTGLPFVFAVWAARPGVETGELEVALATARDDGTANIEKIAAREANLIGMPLDACQRYLSEHLHFTLGEHERQGLTHFYENARRLHLVPGGWKLSSHGCTTR